MSESFKVGEAPWEKPQRTANSARPSSVPKPVPKATTPQPTPTDAPEAIPVGAAPWEQEGAPVEQGPQEIPDDQFAPEPGFLQANAEQFQNLGDRVLYGLSADNTEALGKLQSKYGPQNVTMRKGEIWFRKDATKKMKRLDPDQFELFADIIPDGARNIIMEAAMLPAEIGLGMSPLGPAGAAMGRVASVPMATRAAEGVARAAGIPRNPERDPSQEAQIGMAIEALIPGVGGPLARYGMKKLPGTAAYKAAKEAAKKEVVALSDASEEVVSALTRLNQEGTELNPMLHQIQPDSPQVQTVLNSAQKNQPAKMKQAEIELANDYRNVLEAHLNEIGRLKGGKVENPAEIVTNAVRDLERNEGKAIGKYHAKALAATKNQKQALPQEFRLQAKELMDAFGFTYRAGKDGKITPIPPKDIKSLLGSKGLTKPGEVRSVINALEELGKVDAAGGARLTDLDRLVTVLGDLNPKLKGSAAGNAWGRLTGDLRQHRRQVIGNALNDPFEKQAFNVAMDDFSLIRRNVDQLSDVLRGDVTAKTMVNSFFKGKENLANIRAIKKITGDDSAAFASLQDEFTASLLNKFGGKDSLTRYNSEAFLRELRTQYGDDFLREVYKPKDLEKLQDILTVGSRIEKSINKVKPDMTSEKVAKGMTDALIGMVAGVKFKVINGVTGMLGLASGKYHPVMELLNKDGFHKYVSSYKGPGDKEAIARNVEAMLMQYNAARSASKTVEGLHQVGKGIVEGGKRAAKADLRQGNIPFTDIGRD